MDDVISKVSRKLEQPQLEPTLERAGRLIADLVQEDAYVGDVYSLSYADALVQIHDHHRARVGGIPALSFLVATRINLAGTIDIREEDASVLLLRVLDHADLPNAAEALRVRVETAQRVSGEIDKHWDDRTVMDATTHNILSYAGVRCRASGRSTSRASARMRSRSMCSHSAATSATTIRTRVSRVQTARRVPSADR